jgi:hypothetical protein
MQSRSEIPGQGRAPARVWQGVALLLAALVLAACGAPAASTNQRLPSKRPGAGAKGGRSASAGVAKTKRSSTTTTTTTTTLTSTSTTATVPVLRTNPAGALPQTTAFPSTNSRQFHVEMRDLWQGILTDSLPVAIWSFFPEAAYDHLKAISDPDADWHSRLVGEFELDLGAAHRYIAAGPGGTRGARLLTVEVASGEASWIQPGYCYNSIGYWHAPGARIVYEQHGQERSIGIASLISWRGQWYVVHFGAVLRNTATGIVDAPSPGAGQLPPPGGC